MCQTNTSQEKTGMTILVLDKVDFRSKNITRDEKGHFLITK